MIRHGLRNLALTLVALCAATGLLSLLIGAAADISALRAVSAGYMLVGSFLFTGGALVGLRDPGRSRRRERLSGRSAASSGLTMWADAFQLSAVLVGFGICLVLLGVLLHPRTAL